MQTDERGFPIATQYSEEGFVDLVFRIVNLTEVGDQYVFGLLASHDDELVGLGVSLFKHVEAGLDSELNLIQDHVYPKGVVFNRSGPESDALITHIAGLYGMADGARRMVKTESFTAIALHQTEISLDQGLVKLKLFGRDGPPWGPDDCYESFFNVDLQHLLVYWNEKDPDWRRPLLAALSDA